MVMKAYSYVDDILPLKFNVRDCTMVFIDKPRFPHSFSTMEQLGREFQSDLLLFRRNMGDYLNSIRPYVKEMLEKKLSPLLKWLGKRKIRAEILPAYTFASPLMVVAGKLGRILAGEIKYIPGVHPLIDIDISARLFFLTEESKADIQSLDDLYRSYNLSFDERGPTKRTASLDYEILKRHGEVLGYPRDCVERFAECRRDFTKIVVKWGDFSRRGLKKLGKKLEKKVRQGKLEIPELMISTQIKKDKELWSVLKRDVYMERLYSFFSEEFFPCKIDCSSASEIGRKMYKRYKEHSERWGKIFQDFTKINAARIAVYGTNSFYAYDNFNKSMLGFMLYRGALRTVYSTKDQLEKLLKGKIKLKFEICADEISREMCELVKVTKEL